MLFVVPYDRFMRGGQVIMRALGEITRAPFSPAATAASEHTAGFWVEGEHGVGPPAALGRTTGCCTCCWRPPALNRGRRDARRLQPLPAHVGRLRPGQKLCTCGHDEGGVAEGLPDHQGVDLGLDPPEGVDDGVRIRLKGDGLHTSTQPLHGRLTALQERRQASPAAHQERTAQQRRHRQWTAR